MTKTERKIIYQCYVSLSCLPGQGNAMSARGASEYSAEMKTAIGLNTRAISFLLDGDTEMAQSFANDLTSLVYATLIRNGLSVVGAFDELRKAVKA